MILAHPGRTWSCYLLCEGQSVQDGGLIGTWCTYHEARGAADTWRDAHGECVAEDEMSSCYETAHGRMIRSRTWMARGRP